MPNISTLPPKRVMWTEFSSCLSTPVVSIVRSAPRPSVAAGDGEVGAQLFGHRALLGAARDADDARAARLRELHVQLAGDAQADDGDGVAGERLDLPLRVQAGGEDLDQRRGAVVNRVRQPE